MKYAKNLILILIFPLFLSACVGTFEGQTPQQRAYEALAKYRELLGVVDILVNDPIVSPRVPVVAKDALVAAVSAASPNMRALRDAAARNDERIVEILLPTSLSIIQSINQVILQYELEKLAKEKVT